MSEDVLTTAYYGNTIQEWGTALLIVIGALIAGKILYWICGNTLRRLTGKTETKLDVILLDMAIDDAAKLVISAGLVAPPQAKLKELADAAKHKKPVPDEEPVV